MWVAGKLGQVFENKYASVRILMTEEQDSETDFELLLDDDKPLRFQVTELLDPDRKRGDEYKERAKGGEFLQPYGPARGMQEGPDWIASAVKNKSNKNYDPKPHLVVYANFHAEDLDKSDISCRCRPYKDRFPSFWVLQNHRVIQVWGNEQTCGWAEDWINLPLDDN